MPGTLSPPYPTRVARPANGSRTSLAGLRIALLHGADPEDPRSYSVCPSHLIGALRNLEVDVRPVSAWSEAPIAELPRPEATAAGDFRQ